jgi:hypothetical protein
LGSLQSTILPCERETHLEESLFSQWDIPHIHYPHDVDSFKELHKYNISNKIEKTEGGWYLQRKFENEMSPWSKNLFTFPSRAGAAWLWFLNGSFLLLCTTMHTVNLSLFSKLDIGKGHNKEKGSRIKMHEN